MCGRFALFSDPTSIARALRLSSPSEGWQPRYNVAPGTWITSVRRPEPEAALRFENLWWGYRPHWADEKAPQPINATAEEGGDLQLFQGRFRPSPVPDPWELRGRPAIQLDDMAAPK